MNDDLFNELLSSAEEMIEMEKNMESFMSLGKCNCGREGRYSHMMNKEYVLSCNKYSVCKTYDELLKDYNDLKRDFTKLHKAAIDMSLYREGTSQYQEAVDTVESFSN